MDENVAARKRRDALVQQLLKSAPQPGFFGLLLYISSGKFPERKFESIFPLDILVT